MVENTHLSQPPPRPDTCEPLKAAVVRGELRLAGFAHGDYPGTVLPRRQTPEIRSVGVWDARQTQAWGLDWHCNEGIEFTFLLRGRTPFAAQTAKGEQSWLLTPGQLTVTRPWQPHRVGAPRVPAGRLAWFILDVGARHPHEKWRWPDWLVLSRADLARLTDLLRHNEQPVWSADDALAGYFARLAQVLEEADGKDFPETQVKLRINEALVGILDLLDAKGIPLDARLADASRAVERFLGTLPGRLDHPWTLEEMARASGLERTQFARRVHALTGRTPIAHLTDLRVAAADVLLAQTPRRRITDIALACGFGSGQYFATVYKRWRGRAPRDAG